MTDNKNMLARGGSASGGKKALVIFTPSAGLETKKNIEAIVREKLSNLKYQVDLFYLDRTFEVKLAGYDFSDVKLVVAVGGDGTVKVAARTILKNKLSAPLEIIPFGSANVVALELGLPLNIKKALAILDNLDKTVKIDVGIINNIYYFVVGFSVGYVSEVVTGTPRGLKKKLGFFGYVISLIFNKIKIRKNKFAIRTQNKIFWVKGNSLVVFNILNYFGFKPKKNIDFKDGILNLYVFTKKTFFSMFWVIFDMMRYQRPPSGVFYLDNNYFKITLKRKLKSCQIDGDYVSLPRDIEIRVLPRVLEVVVGK